MNNTFQILEGHFLDVADQIPDGSIHVCVNSPPYYGLRTYGTEPQIWKSTENFGVDTVCKHKWDSIRQYKDSWRRGQSAAGFHSSNVDRNEVGARRSRSREELRKGRWTHSEYCVHCNAWKGELGQEPSPELYIEHLVQIYAVVWNKLRPEGTLWVNIADAYYNYRPGNHDDARAQGYNRLRDGSARDVPSFTPKRGYKLEGYKEKDLMLIPWRFAIAMQEFGWYVRSVIIWHKPNPLSESVDDRPTNAYEPVLLFAKQEKYYYDKWAITEPPTGNAHPRGKIITRFDADTHAEVKILEPSPGSKRLTAESRNNDSFRTATVGTLSPGGRNKRTVWTINVQGYPDDHYAAYPEELPETVIKAATSAIGCCRTCGAQWSRVVLRPAPALGKNEPLENRWRRAAKKRGIDIEKAITGDSITLGWKRNCKHYDAGAPVPATVLDPFTGRGTTGVMALRYGRNFVGSELQPSYLPLIKKNLRLEAPLWVKEL